MNQYTDDYLEILEEIEPVKKHGKVIQVIGLTIESRGPYAKIGELCLLYPNHTSGRLKRKLSALKKTRSY